ncbi:MULTISPECIES: hypothetical protein [Enterococcus]|uniref:hypothetical protein n=1 Tax=Enterococcus TaxID=1350 RepID=UPI000448F8AC|nr:MULTISPECIES: hypothetical protein [Enterococcus]EYT94603.1 hypothetical protein AK89_12980 [Enterococcus mundtii CRL35]SFE57363.1 hypothetical protein SAMN04487887_11726 [Enterococcus casseliflavus]
MNTYVWLFILIAVAIVSLIAGMTFLVLDLQRPKAQWRLSIFLTDITLLIIFFLSSGGAIYVYLLFQKQIEFFN